MSKKFILPNKTFNLILEVDNNFNLWEFHKEFKKLQYKGFFKNVKSMTRLDKKEILQDKDIKISKDEVEEFGIQ